MKLFIFFLLALSSFMSIAQSTVADPALGNMNFTTKEDNNISNTQVPLNDIIKLKVPLFNLNLSSALPNGTCKIKIGLGSKLILDPLFNLNNALPNNYFSWTSVNSGGQTQITGELVADLPSDFSDTAIFDLKGFVLGSSTITSNFLVTNHNSPVLLSDENGSNNIAALPYTIIDVTVPLTLTNFNLTLVDCKPNLKWVTENEINTSHFEIERAYADNNWTKIGTVNAQFYSTSRTTYSFADDFTSSSNHKIFYRLKMIDRDGGFSYSKILTAFTNCKNVQLSVYPNPIVNDKINFTINGFSDVITATLKTSSGQTIGIYQVNNGTNSIEASILSNGVYLLIVSDKKGASLHSKVIIQR